MPIQAPQWTEFLSCPVCCHDFDVAVRGPISLGCGHTICRTCLANLHRKQCPFDQSTINTEIERLPINEALLQLVGNTVPTNVATSYQKLLPPEDHANYLVAKRCVEELALYLKPCQTHPTIAAGMGLVSRPMQRKLVTLVGCQLVEPEGRARAVRAARSLGERSVTELILQHQNPQQLSANLWAAVRARGCQFLGPAMQEEVLKLVLLALEDGSALSRKVLVMFVVQRLEPHFSQASKTSIGHVVQLLYRASCFKVSKREGDSSLMQLKEEFRTYDALRREHDAQIVQIATEAGLRIAPDQWSALLYGDTGHKSHMQSIIDKLQTPQSFAQSVQELVIALQRTPDPGQLSGLRPQLELLAAIDPSPETELPTLAECRAALEAVRTVVVALVEFIQQHGSRKCSDGTHNIGPSQPKYKVSMCRDLALRGSCPRATNCTFAHSDMELDKYRSKNRKLSIRSNLPLNSNTELKTDKSIVQNNKVFKQNEEAHYHSIKPHDIHRDSFTSLNKVNPTQHPIINSENNLVGSVTNYMLAPPQNLSHMVPVKNMDIHCPHYIMPVASLDYNTTDMNMWDSPQVTSGVTNGISNSKKNCDIQGDVLSSNLSIWTNSSGSPIGPSSNMSCSNNFRCADPVLLDDEFVPFDASSSSKYGPISKISTTMIRSPNCVSPTSLYNEGPTTISTFRPMPPNSISSWYYGNQPYTPIGTNGGMQSVTTSNYGDGYIALGRNISESHTHSHLLQQECMSKDNIYYSLILESQKVKQQLKHLEKKINDLKIATQGATLTASEKLAQELQMIEAGIREKEKDVRNWSPYGTVPWIQSSTSLLTNQSFNQDYKTEEEDTYEAGIANDMRELELRWEFELQEQEKHWSSEEDSSKK
ncbi:PREDICTED: roquin-1 isoform X3 [Polistes dominula]|uniref:RING-type E3 ubiquitin transferase n=1 Tax=Polistes dominula TaxID=743375 RepID=A0ABM1IF35_POLDO|nr:PREDICTED: roquin-1 isoform X3 [Polistes dominula]